MTLKFLCVLSFCIDIYFHIIYNSFEIEKCRNVDLSSLYTKDKEVMLMIEDTLVHIIILLSAAWIITTIIAFALIIALAIIISK